MHYIRLLQKASRDLAKLDKPIARRVVRRLQWLAENLDQSRSEKLTGGLAGLYKLRVGDYRVVYQIICEEQVILVHAIGHRREVYDQQ